MTVTANPIKAVVLAPTPETDGSGQAGSGRQGGALLRLNRLSKAYGGAHALDGVSLEIRRGEIHALVGENGAGKTTLIRLCTGVERPDSGEIVWQGEAMHLHGPGDARMQGIRVVHQEAEFFPELSLAENLMHAGGVVPGHPLWLDWRGLRLAAERELGALAVSLPVERRAGSLSVGQRMMAEIAACLAQRSRLLFFDEPTASLSAGESENLFAHLTRLRTGGTAVVYVSHRLDEVLRLADYITVLRDGRVAAAGPRGEFDRVRLVRAMVGRDIQPVGDDSPSSPCATVLALEAASDRKQRLQGVTLNVRAGEIVALYGLVGAGRSELAQGMVGLRAMQGRMTLHDRTFAPSGPAEALRAGVALVPEDRRTEGIFATHSCRENVTAPWLGRLGRAGFFSVATERQRAGDVARRLGTRYRDIDQPVAAVSGGNQQKLLLGRWLETDPAVLLVDEPTRGVDVGAKTEIHAALRRLARQGRAVLVISSDLPEVLHLGDRIYVMRAGRISGEFQRAEATEAELVQAALPPSAAAGGSVASAADRRGHIVRIGRELGVFGGLAAMVVLLTVLCGREFASAGNLVDILAAASLVSIAAAGMAQVLIAGGIDISIGSMLGLTGAVAGTAAMRGLPPVAAVGLGIVLGAALGALNAAAAYRGRIHPIIVTMAGIYVFRGLMLRFTGGYEISGFSAAFRALADGRILGVPKVVWIAALVHAGNAWFLGRTLPGRRLYAVGGSEKAAVLCGLRPVRVRGLAFTICGGLVGLTSILWGAYYGKIQSNTGMGFELQVIAAAVIGGCSVTGGRGRAMGVVAGSVLIAAAYNALVLLRISSYWQGVFVGLIILAAPAMDAWIQGRAQWRAR